MKRLKETFGDVAALVSGSNSPLYVTPSPQQTNRTIFAFGAEANKQVLSQPTIFENRAPRGSDRFKWLSTNLSMANGERHTQHRRLFLPAFSRGHLRSYFDDMLRFTQDKVGQWETDTKVNMALEMEDLTTSISSKAFYGQEIISGKESLARSVRETVEMIFSPSSMFPVDLPGLPYRRLTRLATRTIQEILEEINRRRAAGTEGEDVLSMMIRAHEEGSNKISDDELAGNAFLIYFAGHKSSSLALTLTLFLLALHPEIQEELQAELDQELGGEPPSYEQLGSLSVLDRVVKEGLRIITPAVAISRFATHSTELLSYQIPEGSEVIYSPYMTHIDPAVYPEPTRFRPDRWKDFKPTPYQYIPFGVGVHSCIGASFAQLQLRLIVAMVAQKFRLHVPDNVKIDFTFSFTLNPKPEVPVVFRSRDSIDIRRKPRLHGLISQMIELP